MSGWRQLKENGFQRIVDISLIIPVKDEEESITELAVEAIQVMQNTPWSWECLWIDDGSVDHTQYKLETISRNDPHHRFLCLSQNFGQSAALHTGFKYARGKILVTLDGDGQNDPGEIPMLVNTLLDEGADMVNGWRPERMDTFFRKISSRIANGFRNWITHDRIRDVGCSLRAFHHECVENIPLFAGMHRFLPTLARISGYTRIIDIPVHHRPRKHGVTKYGIQNRLWVGLGDTFAVRWMKSRLVFPVIREPFGFEQGRKNNE